MNPFIHKKLVLFVLLTILMGGWKTLDAQNNIDSISKEYKILKTRKNNKKPGEFIKELDACDGRFHQLLSELGDILRTPDYNQNDIIRIMGKPDWTIVAGGHHSNITVPSNEVHLIYYWRGWHDYLYFVCKDGTIKESKWYFALE